MTKSDAFDKFHSYMRLHNYSSDTRKQYNNWVERYFKFIAHMPEVKKLPSSEKFNAFIFSIVNANPQPSISTQNQAFSALLTFYRSMGQTLEGLQVPKGRRDQKTPNVLSSAQIVKLIDHLHEEYQLPARLMYGTGMRIDECLSLRVKDVDFEHGLIYIQEGKGDKARRVDLPASLVEALQKQIEAAATVWEYDTKLNQAGVYMPHAMESKNPALASSLEWFWVFPNPRHGWDREEGIKRRHHVYDFALQAAFREARKLARLPVYTTPHALRHAYATHYLQRVLRDLPPVPNLAGYVRDLLRQKMGHVSAETTDVYIHLAMPKDKVINYSPLDGLEEK